MEQEGDSKITTSTPPVWKVAVLGASVYNFTMDELQEWLNANSPYPIALLDYTQIGLTSVKALEYIPSIQQAKPDAIIASLGGNDVLIDAVSPAELQKRLHTLYGQLNALNIPILMVDLQSETLTPLFQGITRVREKILSSSDPETIRALQQLASDSFTAIVDSIKHPENQSYLDKLRMIGLLSDTPTRLTSTYHLSPQEAFLAAALLKFDYINSKGDDDITNPIAHTKNNALFTDILVQYTNVSRFDTLLEGVNAEKDSIDFVHPTSYGQQVMAAHVGKLLVQRYEQTHEMSPVIEPAIVTSCMPTPAMPINLYEAVLDIKGAFSQTVITGGQEVPCTAPENTLATTVSPAPGGSTTSQTVATSIQ